MVQQTLTSWFVEFFGLFSGGSRQAADEEMIFSANSYHMRCASTLLLKVNEYLACSSSTIICFFDCNPGDGEGHGIGVGEVKQQRRASRRMALGMLL
jgi:hypothetical protein